MLSKLPPRERQIVDILYERGALPVADICDALPDPAERLGRAGDAQAARGQGLSSSAPNSERGFLYSPVVSDTAPRNRR